MRSKSTNDDVDLMPDTYQAVAEVLRLMNESLILDADDMLQRLHDEIERDKVIPGRDTRAITLEARLAEYQDQFDKLRGQAKEVRHALADTSGGEGWIHSSKMFGVDTSYKFDESEDGSIWIKLEGRVENLPLFEQVVPRSSACLSISCGHYQESVVPIFQLTIIKEADLFKTWAPFCNRSERIQNISFSEQLVYVSVCLPPAIRDTTVYGFAADCTYSHGCICIICKSVDEWEDVPLPHTQTSTGLLRNKLTVKGCRAIINIASPTEARTTILANIDPHAPLPQYLLNTILRNLAGVLLYKLESEARAVLAQRATLHCSRIHEDLDFYVDWLLRKMLDYNHHKGWGMLCVPSLGLHPETLNANGILELAGSSERRYKCEKCGYMMQKVSEEVQSRVNAVIAASPFNTFQSQNYVVDECQKSKKSRKQRSTIDRIRSRFKRLFKKKKCIKRHCPWQISCAEESTIQLSSDSESSLTFSDMKEADISTKFRVLFERLFPLLVLLPLLLTYCDMLLNSIHGRFGLFIQIVVETCARALLLGLVGMRCRETFHVHILGSSLRGSACQHPPSTDQILFGSFACVGAGTTLCAAMLGTKITQMTESGECTTFFECESLAKRWSRAIVRSMDLLVLTLIVAVQWELFSDPYAEEDILSPCFEASSTLTTATFTCNQETSPISSQVPLRVHAFGKVVLFDEEYFKSPPSF